MSELTNLIFRFYHWLYSPRRYAGPMVLPSPSVTKGRRPAIHSLAAGPNQPAQVLGFWSAIILATLALANVGTAATVRIRLETTDLNSNVVSSVNVGEQFLLRGYVTDLRPNPQGVFASYLNVDYAPGSSVTATGVVTFIAPFTNGSSANTTNAGSIQGLGSFAGISPTGAGEKPQFNVRFRASAPGTVTFTGSPAAGAAYYVLVFGVGDPVPANELQFINPTIVVNGTTVPPLRISQIEIRTNGTQLSFSGPLNTTIQLQSVTNLTNHVWQNLGGPILLGSGGTAGFMDFTATNHPIRFYRAYQP